MQFFLNQLIASIQNTGLVVAGWNCHIFLNSSSFHCRLFLPNSKIKLDCASKCYFPLLQNKPSKKVVFITGFLENENRCQHSFCDCVLKMGKNYMLKSYQWQKLKFCKNKWKIVLTLACHGSTTCI